eukprot:6119297-Pyramimonas_sp.AAC.1
MGQRLQLGRSSSRPWRHARRRRSARPFGRRCWYQGGALRPAGRESRSRGRGAAAGQIAA